MTAARAMLFLFLALLIGGCSVYISEAEATEISQRYLEERFEDEFHREGFTVHDDGERFVVNYAPPEGWTGGRMTLILDKETGRIISFYGEQ